MKIFQQLAEKISWEKYLNVWKNVTGFRGILYPTREEYEDVCSNSSTIVEDVDKVENSRINRENNENTVLHFRVTCYRSGKHSFGSQDAAWHFGGRLQDRFNWVVDLSNYHLEIVLCIRDGEYIVSRFDIYYLSIHSINLRFYSFLR